jgi:predicted methyltransferase
MNRRVWLKTAWALTLGSLLAGCAAAAPDYGAILTSADRPQNERELDGTRKPNEVLAFYGVKQGDKVVDLLAGRGYYTAILSQVVGSSGLVYSANASSRPEINERWKKPGYGNVKVIDGPMDKIAVPQDGALDFALTHLNYHDLPQPVRAAMNKRILAALRKGGIYGVVDHSARPGSGDAESKTLHRIDKDLVIKEVTEAGFKLVKEGGMLSRADDKRDFNVLKVRNQDDRFVLAFVKP